MAKECGEVHIGKDIARWSVCFLMVKVNIV